MSGRLDELGVLSVRHLVGIDLECVEINAMRRTVVAQNHRPHIRFFVRHFPRAAHRERAGRHSGRGIRRTHTQAHNECSC